MCKTKNQFFIMKNFLNNALGICKSCYFISIPFLVLFCNPPTDKYAKQKSLISESLLQERRKLKNLTFCNCLNKSIPEQSDFLIEDGSTSGYFETSAYDLIAIERIDSLAAVFSKKKYESVGNKTLSIMKCLDFYNSNELAQLVLEMDQHVNYEKLK